MKKTQKNCYDLNLLFIDWIKFFLSLKKIISKNVLNQHCCVKRNRNSAEKKFIKFKTIFHYFQIKESAFYFLIILNKIFHFLFKHLMNSFFLGLIWTNLDPCSFVTFILNRNREICANTATAFKELH